MDKRPRHSYARDDWKLVENEPQQTLLPWAEFMADEPVKPKAHKSKPQPATLSMFEWALTLEQEREAEPVGVGR